MKSIWRYIARDSVKHADLVEDAIYETFHLAAKTPALGHSRPDVGRPKVLFLGVLGYDKYLIAYVKDSKPLRIIRVFQGARDVPKLRGFQ